MIVSLVGAFEEPKKWVACIGMDPGENVVAWASIPIPAVAKGEVLVVEIFAVVISTERAHCARPDGVAIVRAPVRIWSPAMITMPAVASAINFDGCIGGISNMGL